MNEINRIVIKIAGQSGQGINSLGEILARGLKNSGYHIFAYREYPSLIKGGYASYQIDVSDDPISSSSLSCHLLVCISRQSIGQYLSTLKPSGILIHSLPKLSLTPAQVEFIAKNQIKVEYVDAQALAMQIGKLLFVNVILASVVWKLLGQDLQTFKTEVADQFDKKPELLAQNYQAIEMGFNLDLKLTGLALQFTKKTDWYKSYVITGNAALALGALGAGVRAFYSYPMTPSSSILTYLADFSHETGMLIKQAEDEITAVQMTAGSMFMGTRALVATSGGGFDLMTETISMSAMTETPLVCIIAQRPGPGTGLPTWTANSDLNLAVYAGHGEFVRCVVAASDINSAYSTVQSAFNLAEQFQIPVLVMTDKQIAEALYNIEQLPANLPITRHLLNESELLEIKAEDRYKYSEDGISPRWLPGQSLATFDANSDEHLADGSTTEEAQLAQTMYQKRLNKLNSLLAVLPEPELLGAQEPEILLVGWGSAKSAIVDALTILSKSQNAPKISYLHYEYLFPLKTEKLLSLIKDRRVVLIENNYLGQLGRLIRQETGYEFSEKILKYDGRPFFIEDILNYFAK